MSNIPLTQIQIRNPLRTGLLIPSVNFKESWAEKQVWKLRGVKNRFLKRMQIFYFTLINIFVILPIVSGLVVGGAIFISNIGCNNLSTMWGLCCGMIGYILHEWIKYKFFNRLG